VVVDLAVGGGPLGQHSTVICARPSDDARWARSLGIDLVPLDFAFEHRLTPWRRLVVAAKAARAARRSLPDVVHLHSGTVWMGLALPLTVPRAATVLEIHDAPGSGRLGSSADRWEGTWARLTRAHVLCHSTSVEAAVRDRWKVRAERVHLVPLAANPTAFDRPDPATVEAWRARQGLGDRFTAVVVGRLAPSKAVDVAVRAVAEAIRAGADVELVVVGDGEQRPVVEAVAAECHVSDRVRMMGRVSDSELRLAVASADVLVSTSTYEGFGLTIVEAMAAGLPVIAVAVGGVVDIVVDGVTGHLVPAGDVAGIADRLARLAADPAAARAMGEAGRQRAEDRFTLDRLAAGVAAVYQEALR
jgi:glycosyltransferase involved in cell wall biosynthesis